jgi:hypothetical protein
VGPRGQSGQVRQISPPPGFNPWTAQPVASHYTDYAVLAHSSNENFFDVCMLIYMLMNAGGNNDDTSFLRATCQIMWDSRNLLLVDLRHRLHQKTQMNIW